jgi:hypothetical protein
MTPIIAFAPLAGAGFVGELVAGDDAAHLRFANHVAREILVTVDSAAHSGSITIMIYRTAWHLTPIG